GLRSLRAELRYSGLQLWQAGELKVHGRLIEGTKKGRLCSRFTYHDHHEHWAG
ncbi:unnamed protein product, partial [Heterosigma akashiwo]